MPRPLPLHSPDQRLERGIHGIFINAALCAGVLACVIAQVAKVFTHYAVERKWEWSRIVSSGGMPSSHTALIVGVTAAIGVSDGTSSNLFALAAVFCLVVAYDASGVRLHAGRHASVLNAIIMELPTEHSAKDVGVLRDSLGHTPLEVFVGAIVGLIVGYLFAVLWGPSRHVVVG